MLAFRNTNVVFRCAASFKTKMKAFTEANDQHLPSFIRSTCNDVLRREKPTVHPTIPSAREVEAKSTAVASNAANAGNYVAPTTRSPVNRVSLNSLLPPASSIADSPSSSRSCKKASCSSSHPRDGPVLLCSYRLSFASLIDVLLSSG